jgi:hypothetical protein
LGGWGNGVMGEWGNGGMGWCPSGKFLTPSAWSVGRKGCSLRNTRKTREKEKLKPLQTDFHDPQTRVTVKPLIIQTGSM